MSNNDVCYNFRLMRLLLKLEKCFPCQYKLEMNFIDLPPRNRFELRKGNSTVNPVNNTAVINIDLKNHDSLSDMRHSVYHEYRHVLQYNLLNIDYIIFWNRFLQDNPQYRDLSPLEIDAEVFAEYEGKLSGMEVFEAIGKLSDYESEIRFWGRCKAVHDYYLGVHPPYKYI